MKQGCFLIFIAKKDVTLGMTSLFWFLFQNLLFNQDT